MPTGSIETIVQKTATYLAASFLLFIFLGFLILIGLRREVVLLLRGLFEGTLQVFEAIEILKQAWKKLVNFFQRFLNFIAPTIAIGISVALYYYLMKLYKIIGKTGDVTRLTIILTVGTISVISLLSAAGGGKKREKTFLSSWLENLRRYFVNSFEVMTLTFFLTIDWETPYFLPQELWGPIRAKLGPYDLMVRGISINSRISFTLWLAGLSVLIETIRRLLRIIAAAIQHYRSVSMLGRESRVRRFRTALRASFEQNLDSVIKFIGFTTVVVLAFFLFPRLKLISLVFYSITSLFWDVLIPKRLASTEPSRDLLSTVVVNVFNL